jgi:hypothetical protein
MSYDGVVSLADLFSSSYPSFEDHAIPAANVEINPPQPTVPDPARFRGLFWHP